MPKLWNDTIEAHRREVRDAILDTARQLVIERGPGSVTMSEIADKTGIGRATLYKYFPDVTTILDAWLHRQINRHLEHLVEVRDRNRSPMKQLRAVLEAFAVLHQTRSRQHRREPEFASLLHRNDQITQPRQRLHAFIRDLLDDAAQAGHIRDDVTTDELARYCMNALTASNTLDSNAAVRRLVTVTLAGLRPHPDRPQPGG